jgi:arsenical pump membrane protein
MIDLSHILTLVVLVATILVLVLRPRGVNEGLAAMAGAAAVLLLGTATLADVGHGASETAGILVFLIAMMIVAIVAEEAGCFDWAAGQAVALSRGSGRLLFLNLYVLGALVTVFLSLDVTAIMIAPIVCALVRRARLSPLPFVMACAFVANTASLFLPVSNLTNMLVYSLLHVPFWAFVRLMTLPNLAAMAVNLVVFFVIFRKLIPARFVEPDAGNTSRPDPVRLTVAGVGLATVVVGLIVFGGLGLPLWIPAVVGAAILTPIALVRQDVRAERLLDGVAWSLPMFVIGMYTVITAAGRAGLADVWHALLPTSSNATSLSGLLAIAFSAAAGANLFNNIPMSLVVIASLSSASATNALASAFASLIGTNIGPNVTVFGSLATILVLHAARRNRIDVSSVQYLKIGLLTVPLMIVASTMILWLVLR